MIFPRVTWISLAASFGLFGCMGAPSVQNTLVQDRLAEYQRASKEYHTQEEDYLNLLSNLEQEPTDSDLVQVKKAKMKVLTDQRSVMLESRAALDDAVQQWETQIHEAQIDSAKMAAPNSKIKSADFQNLKPKPAAPKPISSLKASSSANASPAILSALHVSSSLVMPRSSVMVASSSSVMSSGIASSSSTSSSSSAITSSSN